MGRSLNSTIICNDISSNQGDGLTVVASSENDTISYNQISGNVKYGLNITAGSCRFRVHHNNFIDNNGAGTVRDLAHVQACDTNGTNFWNDASEGNYWSDWTSPDNDPPVGIVDSPYLLDGGKGANDSFPLTDPVINTGPQVPDIPIPAPLIIVCILLLTAIVVRRRKRSQPC